MGDRTENKPNSLSTLIGQYMSDSDNDDDQNSSRTVGTSPPETTTFWTECLDKTTGHPYYWSTDTKEVTWEKPQQYINYLNYMKSIYNPLPEDSWTVGYSDDSQIPYYVNEITRVVSWEKPSNFKDQKLQRTTETKSESVKNVRTERIKRKKQVKKALPKHLQKTESDDEKIEVISEYVEQDHHTSSDDEESPAKKDKEKASNKKLILVAAYATDSEGEESSKIPLKKSTTPDNTSPPNDALLDEKSEISTSKLNINANSFASIITGGKSDDIDMDEELSKFKEELEKDFQNAKLAEKSQEDSTEVKEQSFDEKTFQRKRRIEFNAKTTSKATIDDTQEKSGSGFTKESNESAPDKAKSQFIAFQKSHVEFDSNASPERVVYGPKPLSPEPSEETEIIPCNRTEDKAEIDDLCDVISGKVKFLSVGKPDISAVQIMSIQLEALQSAFHASCLDSDYFFKWLKTTSDDLLTLEKNAAPEGWECKWDRDNSQYSYKNLQTNETRWEFPCESVPDTNGIQATDDSKKEEIPLAVTHDDDDAMDISTTPPPPPSPPIISGEVGYHWDPGNNSVVATDATRPADISGELASFYSDIANIDSAASNQPTDMTNDEKPDNDEASPITDDVLQSAKKAKKRKKVKVPGLGSKMQEVSTMVANWQKAQKELGN